jgi:hypothetical protein
MKTARAQTFLSALVCAVLMAPGWAPSAARAANDLKVKPGEFVVEPPTLINLGFEWFVEGDDNRNASVEVTYRRVGDAQWRRALPLLRLQGERVLNNVRFDVIAPNMFAGSILDLEPDTQYEAVFVLSDPDGVRGNPVQRVTVRTRAEPQPYAGGRVFHVYPHGFTGPKVEPSFEGLMCAYNNSCSGTDMATGTRPRVQPGDTLLVHAGVYKYNRYEYTNNAMVNRTVPLEGTYYLTGKGTPERPVAIRAAGDGEVVFDGNGNFALFNVMAADYHYFEGLTFRNTEIAIWAGEQFVVGSKGLTVKRCRFEMVGAGVFTNNSRSSNFYIADSVFLGRNDPFHLIGWASPDLWGRFNGVEGQVHPPVMASYIAVKVYGPGHVVAYNYIADFHDGINNETYGNPDGSYAHDPGNLPDGPKYPPREYWDRRPIAFDVYNNYITNSHDNPIEADGSLHNVRIMRNMLINHPSHAMCNQPTLGGPIYWIRNVAYNLPAGSTRGNATGALFYNNTILSETNPASSSNIHWRNNLMLGQNSQERILTVNTFTNYSSSDYNGFRPNPGVPASFRWNSPPFDVLADFQAPGYTPTLVARDYATLAEYGAATGQDRNSVLVDYDVFVNVPRLDARDIAALQNLYDAADLDFRLRPGSAAVDRGTYLPNVTDDFIDLAPDLGAHEVGREVPHYGPRS